MYYLLYIYTMIGVCVWETTERERQVREDRNKECLFGRLLSTSVWMAWMGWRDTNNKQPTMCKPTSLHMVSWQLNPGYHHTAINTYREEQYDHKTKKVRQHTGYLITVKFWGSKQSRVSSQLNPGYTWRSNNNHHVKTSLTFFCHSSVPFQFYVT